jgi:putative membrane protein
MTEASPPPRPDRPWHAQGEEPDYRFSMANERTFLAWVRTALAVMAAAVAVSQLLPDEHAAGLRRGLGAVLAALALVISAAAYPSWVANQRAMRLGRPLPRPRLLPVVGGVLVVIGIGAFVLVLAG